MKKNTSTRRSAQQAARNTEIRFNFERAGVYALPGMPSDQEAAYKLPTAKSVIGAMDAGELLAKQAILAVADVRGRGRGVQEVHAEKILVAMALATGGAWNNRRRAVAFFWRGVARLLVDAANSSGQHGSLADLQYDLTQRLNACVNQKECRVS